MYGFLATYNNMATETERTQLIEVETLGVEITEREVYLEAMRRAYDGRKQDEVLGNLEFLYS